jgi:hypothetical protein
VIYRLHKRRRRFNALLSGNSNLTRSRFVRLFILSIMLLVIFMPITFYVFAKNLDLEWLPYSWDAVHYGNDWLWIRKIPTNGFVNFDRWVPVGTGILVFLIFGLGKDAMVLYRSWLNKIGIGKFLPRFIIDPGSQDSSNLAMYESGGESETGPALVTTSSWLQGRKKRKDDIEHNAVETNL